MILGLDVSTSITGATILDKDGKVVYNDAWDLRKYKIDKVFIEQSLQSFRPGFSSAKTLSTLSKFNGVVSWMSYQILQVEPEFVAATSARKLCGITVPRGKKGKLVVLEYVLENVPDVTILYTKHGNPKPECYDKADSWVIATAGLKLCQR
jgi:hypothetical protein